MGCDHGTLSLSPAAGLTFVTGDPSMWAGDVSFDGFVSFYAGLSIANAALGGITYKPHRNWNGNDKLSVAADDRGWSTDVRNTTNNTVPSIATLNYVACVHVPVATF